MKKNLVLLLFSILIFSFVACGTDTKEQEPAKFTVDTAFEYLYEKDGYYCNVVMPKVADHVLNGSIINEQLNRYNTLEELKESESWNMAPEASFKRSYNVSNIDGICSLNIIEEYLKENGNGSDPKDYYIGTVTSFYYNEKTSEVLSQGEYLEVLGYTEDDILALFNEKYAEVYSNRTYDFSHIIFWFDGENKLQFATNIIDNMDSNTVDFALMINGEKYETGTAAPKTSPFGEAIKSEENFYDEIWAGSWWIEEYYDGAYVLYTLNKEKGVKLPFHVEITKPNSEVMFKASTFRKAEVGDTKEQIIALYPEIDLEEQKQLNGTEDLISLQGSNGYSYLEFHFENNIVTKIAAGTLID